MRFIPNGEFLPIQGVSPPTRRFSPQEEFLPKRDVSLDVGGRLDDYESQYSFDIYIYYDRVMIFTIICLLFTAL